MSAASNYTENNVINAMLRGVAFPLPTGTFVALHTADPGDTGANEVTTTAFPAYVRRKAEGVGAIGTGWSAPSNGVSSNTNQLTYPGYNGSGTITITHFSVWDALTAGNPLCAAPLQTPRTLQIGDVFVFDAGALTVTQA